jgi:hypothetical protein
MGDLTIIEEPGTGENNFTGANLDRIRWADFTGAVNIPAKYR